MDFLRPFQNNNSFQQNYQSVAFQNNQPQIQFFVVNDIQQAQSANLINTLRPTPAPAYITYSPYESNLYASRGFYGSCNCSNLI